jgi:bifunctional N-acetylglucosamine-1-phosphate-uridyltransferase/glucosamine-1-phosphate-acetyltransferase GlmU-like protein
MSASLDVKSLGWKPRFKVALIAAAFEGMATTVFTKYGVCLDDPQRQRLVFSMFVSAQMTLDHTFQLSLLVSAGHECITTQHTRTVDVHVSGDFGTCSFLVGGA